MSCSLLKGRDSDGFPVFQEKFIRECIRKFPYCDATLLQQLVRSIAPVEIVSLEKMFRDSLKHCIWMILIWMSTFSWFVFRCLKSVFLSCFRPSSQGNDPTALSVLTQAITGQVGFMDAEFCISCGEKGAEKRCSVCKMVSVKTVHWFLHWNFPAGNFFII